MYGGVVAKRVGVSNHRPQPIRREEQEDGRLMGIQNLFPRRPIS